MPGFLPRPKNLVVCVVLVCLAPLIAAQEDRGNVSHAARQYLDHVLLLMQEHALHRRSIDWNRLNDEVFNRAQNAVTTEDTYPAIAFALTQLQEHHSSFEVPDSLSGARRQEILAEMAKMRRASSDNLPPSPFAPQKTMDAHIDTRGQAKYAHVIVPMCIANYSDWKKNEAEFQEFADKLHGLVIEMQAQHPDGWLIDLRGNGGGNMWPMLAGIGPVVGEGMLGSFENSEGQSDSWFYRAGKAGTRSQDGKEEFDAEVLTPPSVFDNLPWVAVLLDRGTASSGEAVAVSFAGRARERSFGEHTAGFSTSNHMFQLSDGAALFLCTAIEMDRNGKRYQDGIDPDVKLPAPVARPIEGDDSVIQAAINWIASSTKSSR